MPSREVYDMDVALMEEADVILAWLDRPSHGAGAEVAIAALAGVPIIAVIKPPLSKFLDGLLDTTGAVKLIQSEHTAVWRIAAALERVHEQVQNL